MTTQVPTIVQRLVACVLVFCPAAYADADEAFSIHGLTLGERIDSVLNNPEFDCGGVSGCFLYTVCTRNRPSVGVVDDDIPLDTLALHYTGERLTAVEVRVSALRFNELVSALTRTHGADDTARPQTGEHPIFEWRKGRQVLRLERVLRGGIATSLILSDRSFLSELIER